MAKRPDHLEKYRATSEAPPRERDAGDPNVGVDLIEHLEREFPVPAPRQATSMDDMVMVATEAAVQIGRNQVIAHLKAIAQYGAS